MPESPTWMIDRLAAGATLPREAVRAAGRTLPAPILRLLAALRWGILIAELVRVTPPLYVEPAWEIGGIIALLLLYNLAIFLLLWQRPPVGLPLTAIVVWDLVLIGIVVSLTRGLASPFAGLFLLATVTAAVPYGTRGGLIVGALGGAILVATSAGWPEVWEAVWRGTARTELVAYLVLVGGAVGYFVDTLEQSARQRTEWEARLLATQYEARQATEAALRQRESEIAREIQRAALCEPPTDSMWQIATRFEPAREVGGDYYCMFAEDARLGALIGDVTGHGVPAALVSTSIAHLVYWLRPMARPETFLKRLNHYLFVRLPADTFASMAFALLDTDREELLLYNAGHPPPFVVHDGNVVRTAETNVLLGVLPEFTFTPERYPFRQGDTLVLYSDGFLSVAGPSGERLDLDAMEALVRRFAPLPVEEFATALVAVAQAQDPVEDDLTLVIVRAAGHAALGATGKESSAARAPHARIPPACASRRKTVAAGNARTGRAR